MFLPIYKAFQPKFGDSAFSTTHNDGFIAKLTSDGILNWSTYKGGDAGDDFYNSAIDLQNNIYVLGRSASENFATGGPGNWQNSGEYDIAISKISPDGKQTYSTLIGGSRGEVAYAIAVDSTNNVVIAGQTDSQDLPIINKQSGYKGFTYDAFLMKLGSCSIARPQISPSNKISLCAGDSVFLSAPTGFTNYRWSNGKSARQIWVKDSGSYTVTITGDDGCTSISLPTQVSIITITQPTISGRSKICFADTTRLFLSGNYSSYKWSTGDTSASIFVNSPGTYSVTAIHMQSGCKVLSQPFALEILPLFMPKIIAPKLKIADGETIEIQADGNYKTYLWSTGFTTKRLFVNSPGKYFYFAQDQNGCEAVSDTIVIEKISSVEENFSQGIFLSPNPVSNILNLSLNSSPAAQTKISICNIFGETIAVICDGDSEKKNFVWIPEPQRSSGMYLVKVSDRSGVKFFPFILEK